MKKPINKPVNPCFSSGPTKKPDGWSVKKIEDKFLGRYHRSEDVKKYIIDILNKTKKCLKVPKDYKIFILPGSCTGAMEAVLWSSLGPRNITSIIFDHWGDLWYKEILKLGLKIQVRKSLGGIIPKLSNIPLKNDLVFVWTGTTYGISIDNTDFISPYHKGLVIADVTSAAFIYEIQWKKIDISILSWQKALGSESQHGMIIVSPKALERFKKIKRKIPKILDIRNLDYLINTPSLLSISDYLLCLNLYIERGGLLTNSKICMANKSVIDNWVKNNDNVEFFVKNPKNRALTPSYLIFKKKFNYKKFFNFLKKEKIAFDIENYRGTSPGIRIWTGPTIKKKDLISLTNWIDWSFYKFIR